MTEGKPSDLLGVKPLGESVKIATQGLVDGASAFLGRICLPAAEEFGFFLRDRISGWRAANAAKIATGAEEMLRKFGRSGYHAHPRLAMQIIEKGSWSEDDLLQKSWSGLLASSCTEKGNDDSNILFASLLDQLTSVQVKIVHYSCKEADKSIAKQGWIMPGELKVAPELLFNLTGISDIHRLDRELDHLRNLGLIGDGLGGGFHVDEEDADISPTALSLNLHVRCQGFSGSAVEYWGLSTPVGEPAQQEIQ